MKKILFLFLSIYISVLFNNSQAQWVWQNPLPMGNSLSGISYTTKSKLFAAGPGGILIKSTNGGVNWNRVYLSSRLKFYGIYFFDSLYGDAYGQYNTGCYAFHYRTTDGGNNWIRNDYCAHYDLQGIQFINQSTGFFLSHCIYKTVNGGLSWISVSETDVWHKFHFPDSDTGYVVGYPGKIQKTINSGNNWSYLPSTGSTRLNSVYFINGTTGFTASSDSPQILKTTDGGNQWTSYPLNSQSGVTAICFANKTTGFCADAGGGIFKTSNCGINWSKTSANLLMRLNSIICYDSMNVIAAGNYGALIKSTDGGSSWMNITSGYFNNTLNSIFFTNSLNGYTAGNNGLILKTTNGGNQWNQLLFYSTKNLNSLTFCNQNTGFACSDSGYFFKTTNAGFNWTSFYIGSNRKLRDIKFQGTDTGYATSGDSYYINYPPFYFSYGYSYKTTDGGNSWFVLQNFTPGIALGVCVTQQRSVYISCNSGNIFKSTDGVYFNYQPTGTQTDLNAIEFIDENTGFAAGGNQIIRTTNGGDNWSSCYNNTSADYKLKRISIFGESIYICGNSGYVFKSTNRGTNWTILETDAAYNFLNGVFFTNELTGYVVGEGCNILKTTNGGVSVSIRTISTEIPSSYILGQNYPNPFNPSTTIRYQIANNVGREMSNVKLIIYNILGKDIETLVNQNQSPGTYETSWDGSGYSSGIYFYSLYADGVRMDTKRMVLIK